MAKMIVEPDYIVLESHEIGVGADITIHVSSPQREQTLWERIRRKPAPRDRWAYAIKGVGPMTRTEESDE